MEYHEFLRSKVIDHKTSGFAININKLNDKLFDWQKVVTRWAIYNGRCAMFEACGLGKTPQQLEWANQVHIKTNKNILILAPLAVSQQTKKEGEKFGIDVNVCRSQSDVKKGINITNYEILNKFEPDRFVGIVLDESSILKAFMGKTKQKIINAFKNTPYKLCCTATPSPNDHMELLNHADFLNIMPSNEALSRWFINDTMNFGTYRLKKHAVKDFWQWVSTWAVCMNMPSDIGFDDDGFVLPELKTFTHSISYKTPYDHEKGLLFKETEIINASNLYKELRETAKERCTLASALIKNGDGWVMWCNTNKEAEYLNKFIPGSVNVHGSMPIEQKEEYLNAFSAGEIPVMVTKPSMCGFGLNWQHVHKMAFVGLSFSFEQRYQAIRRLWRFGQKNRVQDHVILSPAERQVFKHVKRKELLHNEMQENMIANVRGYTDLNINRKSLKMDYDRKVFKGKNYELILGDCVKEIKNIPDASVHFQIFSPPFSNLYIYSDAVQDMGNSKNDKEFFEHFEFIIPEMKRILMPGRLCAVHCKDLVDYKNRDGLSGLRDIPGDIIRLFEKHKWKYHSRVTIWKDPVIEMQRTKAQGLLHAQIKRDSSMCRNGLPDYLLVFRNWPDNAETSGPEPVTRPDGFHNYVGHDIPDGEGYIIEKNDEGIFELKDIPKGDEIFSIHVWQRYASPVWFDIQQPNVLNARVARDFEDEKHICPLQLDVIERSIHLWTNPGDTVFSPFAGIGSELYGAVKIGRKGLGIELKDIYVNHAVKYLEELENKPQQLELF